jgi:hypothetical protein
MKNSGTVGNFKTLPSLKTKRIRKKRYVANSGENTHRLKKASYEVKQNHIKLDKPKTSQTKRKNNIMFKKAPQKSLRNQK